MGKLLRTTGLALIAAWAVLLLGGEYVGSERASWLPSLLSLGLVLVAAGISLSFLGRARRVVQRPRCARCRQPVEHGQIYCPVHFRESVDRIRDSQGEGPS